MNDFTFVRLKFSTWGQKSINSQTNNKFPGNDDLTAEFYEHFSNQLPPDLLDIYDSCRKLGTMDVLEQESYLSYIKKEIKKILQTTDPFHF